MNKLLEQLYDTSADDVRFCLGHMEMLPGVLLPAICIAYGNWPPGLLDAVRDAFHDGLSLDINRNPDGSATLTIATRQLVQLELEESGQTDVLRAPAWSATLEHVAARSADGFNRDRTQTGGCLLVLRTAREAFGCWMPRDAPHVVLGDVCPASTLPIPAPPV